ncbi:hypothetical protein sos41_14470 [Alphaproteobacteria bacterium SO-S41]|nr:hypothetical protein sos41_14470 [Alphaproteobacteria bacterium SO-S41]
MNRFAAALVYGLLGASTALAAPAPRGGVGDVAAAIEAHYFDPAKAKSIADDLRSAAANGAFDALTDPRDLAQTLTTKLKPLDAHFNVEWQGDTPAPESVPGSPPGPRRSYDDELRRTNYGFRKTEILTGNIGLIEMSGFAGFNAKGDPARLAVDAALQSVAHADAIIIDLRQNGGGSPAMVGYLASAFVAPGADIYNVFHGREGTRSEAPSEPYAAPRTDVPVFILISGRTGSAGEAFPYTFQAAKRATIVGEASAGAANPGGTVVTPSGFAVFVSDGSPINPVTGGNWEGTGVIPDVAVPAASALDKGYELALEAALARGLPETETMDVRWTLEAIRAPKLDFTAADYAGTYDDVTITAGDGTLISTRGKRPPTTLKPLAADLFFVADHPERRVHFERDAAGNVVLMELQTSSGDALRLHRQS